MKIFTNIIVILLIINGIIFGQLIVKPNNEYLNYNGRVDRSNSECYIYSWSGVNIQFTVTGTKSIEALFGSDAENEGNWVNVVINNDILLPINISTSIEQQSFNILSDNYSLDPTKSYLVSLSKRNEPMVGNLYFYGLELDNSAQLIGTYLPSRKIEVLGDSITAGYGNLGVAPCNFKPSTQDYYLTYGQMVANQFDAQLVNEAWSGLGIVRNYGSPNITAYNNFRYYYPYINPTYQSNGELWNFTEFQPDLILMNLGDNDYSSDPSVPQELFETTFISWINWLKSQYSPTPTIFMACGPMISQEMPGSPCCEYIQNVANATNSIYIDLLNIQTEPSDFGCDGHPTVSAHYKMAKRVAPYIQKYMSWS